MKASLAFAALLTMVGASSLAAQNGPVLGEVLVGANRGNTYYAQNDRPVVGLRRRADAMALTFWVESDTREAASRVEEIHTVLGGLVDRAAAAGLELVWGSAELNRVTRSNYKNLALQSAGRIDTNRVVLMVKAPLGQSVAETQARLMGFVKAAKGMGRATVETSGETTLTIINPDQYRDGIIKLVAADASHTAGLFGPNFSYTITGIDGQVSWSQVSGTDVLLTLPYRYVIIPR